MVIYGDDYYSPEVIENLTDGESFTFEVCNLNKVKKSYKISEWKKGNGTFVKDEIAIANFKVDEKEFVVTSFIAPNPCQGIFGLNIESSHNISASVIIIDINGKILQTEKMDIREGSNLKEFNMFKFEKGIYYIQIQSKEIHEVHKVTYI